MKNNSWITFLIWGVIMILVFLFDVWIFKTVMATDWPDWVKYLILH